MEKSISAQKNLPLCVDLDGTLIHTDVMVESLLTLLKRNPLYIFLLPFWILQGMAVFKTRIAERVSFNPAHLPYNTRLLDWLQQEKQSGRKLWLCTAAHQLPAEAIAAHLGIFEGTLATSAENFCGAAKARGLAARFGEKQFDYCGNATIDLDVWRVSHGAIVVNAGKNLEARARDVAEVLAVFPPTPGKARAIRKALRLPQWAKNILVFVPLIAAHRMTDMTAVTGALVAFFAFCFCASSIYLLNDMLDLEADRQHPLKSKRPFAAGDLPLAAGFILMPLLLLASFLIAWQLPVEFIWMIAVYFLMTTAYSFVLKRIPVVDTVCLACLYTLRIIAGAAAISVPVSFWLLLFSLFFFLSLALVKRSAELDMMRRSGKDRAAGRDYLVEDLPLLKGFGIASGYLSILVLALYINSPDVTALYGHPQAIWILCLLTLYWISYVWLTTHRGRMHDDPIIFALKDRTSLALGFLACITLLVAI